MGSITRNEKQNKRTGKLEVTYRAFIRRTIKDKSVGKSKVFRKLQEAKDWIAENENKAALAMLGKSRGPTFGDLIEAFTQAPAMRGWKYWAPSHLDFWKAKFGNMKTAEISRADINAAIATLLNKSAMRTSPDGLKPTGSKVTPATVNRYLASLSSVLNYALRMEIIESHPMKGGKVSKLTEGAGRKRILTPDEEQKLYKAAAECRWPMMGLFLRMCLTTGARKSEILHLQWKDVDLEQSVAMALDTKNGEHRALPLVSDVRVSLEAAKRVRPLTSDLIFFDPRNPTRPKNVDTLWRNVRQRAGLWQDRDDRLEHVVLHTTRHTVATKLIREEKNIAKVQKVTGHKTLSQLQRYTHLDTEDAVALAEKVLGQKSA